MVPFLETFFNYKPVLWGICVHAGFEGPLQRFTSAHTARFVVSLVNIRKGSLYLYLKMESTTLSLFVSVLSVSSALPHLVEQPFAPHQPVT